MTFYATDNGSPVEVGHIDVPITVGDVPTPTEQAQTLVDVVVTDITSTNVENSYLANLQKVSIFIQQGKVQSAINQLTAFIQKVDQDYTHGIITQAQRDDFFSRADQLIAALQ